MKLCVLVFGCSLPQSNVLIYSTGLHITYFNSFSAGEVCIRGGGRGTGFINMAFK